MNSRLLTEDLNKIANADLDYKAFQNKTFLVTGATGLIGSLFIKALLQLNEVQNSGIKVIAVVRNIEKAKQLFEDYTERTELTFYTGDICEPVQVEEPVHYILHAASVTTSKTMVDYPVETIDTAIFGTRNMLKLAKEKQVERFVYLSSMEMYGNPEKQYVDEQDLGYLDLKKVRTCYPESKRMCECMVTAWHSEYGINACSARLAQTFGPGILPGENRIFAQLAKSVIQGNDIILHTLGKSEGNYCYTRDAILALFLLMIKGENGEAYNVANEKSHTTISGMAHMVAETIAEGKIQVIYDIPENSNTFGYGADVKMTLNAQKLCALGWKPEVDLEQTYRRLIQEIEERS